jgi:hypothetical protein
MELIPMLIDSIYRDKVLRARKTPSARKIFAPARLFEYARGITVAGIRNQHPHATEAEVRVLFRRRMDIARQLEGRQ